MRILVLILTLAFASFAAAPLVAEAQPTAPSAPTAAQRNQPGGFAADPENRLRWRADSRRLDAECIRDAMLSVAGTLDLAALQSRCPRPLACQPRSPVGRRQPAPASGSARPRMGPDPSPTD